MFMSGKGAILMLAVVVLWAAAPALACLTPVPCHSCCHAMAMDCDSAVTSAVHPCCQLQGSGAAVPMNSAIAPEQATGLHQTMASSASIALSGLASQTPGSAKTPPLRSLSGTATILRI